MKKERNLLCCFFVILAVYVATLFALKGTKFFDCWFYVGLFFIGVYMLIKAYLFRSDSSLFLANLLVGFSVVGVLYLIYHVKTLICVANCFLSVAISFLFNFAFFHKKYDVYYFVFFFILFLALFLFSIYCINLLIMLLLLCGDIAIFVWQKWKKYE